MMVWKLAIKPVRANRPRTAALVSLPSTTRNPSSNGSPDSPDLLRARDPGVEEEDPHRGDHQGPQPPHRAPGHVALGVHRFLGGEWQFLDRQVEPDGKRQGGEDPADPEGQERGPTRVGGDVGQIGGIEIGDGECTKNTASTASEIMQITTENRIVASIPMMLSPTKIT